MAKYIVMHGIRIAKDFIPETFGRLTTVGPRFMLPVGNKGSKKTFQVCECVCGNTKVINYQDMKNGAIISCGCHRLDTLLRRNTKHNSCNSPEYNSWQAMAQRCYNTKGASYPDYGGRGITVCDRWLCPVNGFLNFLADMGPRPSPKHTLERKLVNGNYCPENCEWATRTEQSRNQRSNVLVSHNGKTQCISAWAEEVGLSVWALYSRLRKYGWEPEKALTTPSTRKSRYDD